MQVEQSIQVETLDGEQCDLCERQWAQSEGSGHTYVCRECGKACCADCRHCDHVGRPETILCTDCWSPSRPPVYPLFKIPFRKVREGVKAPTKAYPSDAGWDLYADGDYQIQDGQVLKVRTGVAVAIPTGYAGRIAEKSGLGSTGVAIRDSHPGFVEFRGKEIDASFRGEIEVLVHNLTGGPLVIPRGRKIAQLIVYPVCLEQLVEMDSLPDSDRGDRGFGSSGA